MKCASSFPAARHPRRLLSIFTPILESILSATDTLSGLVAEAEKTNTEILFAELQDPVRQMLRRCGLLDRVGENRVLPTVDDAVQNYLNRYPAARHAHVVASFPSALGAG